MKAFLERFYEEVDDNLGDPHSSARLSKEKRLRDLHTVDRLFIFEKLIGSTLQESNLGYAEAEITFQNNVEFYLLPPGYRQFLELVRLDSEGRIISRIGSKPFHSKTYAVEILSAARGFRLAPPPILDADEAWTLRYNRAPGLLHYAQAPEVGEKTLTLGTPGVDAGEKILLPDYYNGVEIHVYSATSGYPQTRVVQYDPGEGILHLRTPWFPLPKAPVWYEICPTLPYPYDSIYAMDVALLNMGRRDNPAKVAGLMRDREKLWAGARSFFQSNVADRVPERIMPLRAEDAMPMSEIPVAW